MTDAVHAAAERLEQAQRTRTPCPPVRDLLPGTGTDTGIAPAYAVQSRLTEARLARGGRIVGRKIGLTSQIVQRQLGVDQPDFGMLFDDMACPQDAMIDITRLLQPRIEAEIAFVLKEDLDGPIHEHVVRAAVGAVAAALEIVDSRIARWDITIVDTIADNASSGLFVLGDDRIPLDDRDLRTVAMTMTDQVGRPVSSGAGVACLGDPILALTWLARTAQELGSPLRSGDIVLSGALGPLATVTPGASYTARLSGLGTVHASFTGG